MNILRKTEDNPFRFGYRDVERTDERGRLIVDMVPLTEDDVLHPQLEDHIAQNEAHHEDCVYLKGSCQVQLAGQPNTVVLADHLFKWDIAGMGDHGPDIAVVFGVGPGQRSWFDVAREGVRPELIIEVTSPAKRNVDLNIKPRQYWRCQVPYYVIVDELPRRRQRQLRIFGYERGKRGYRRLPLDGQGRLWLEVVQMWLGQENNRVVCYDKQGRPLPTVVEAEQARQQAEQARQQAEQARQQAEQARQHEEQARRQAEAEVARLQERLRQLGGNP